MNLEYAMTVEGFLEPPEAEWLAQQAKNSWRILEIGSWKGKSASVFAANTIGHVFCVDTWCGKLENGITEKTNLDFFREFRQNTSRFPSIVPIVGDSLEVARALSVTGAVFDLIFIDATHSYESCKADIIAWSPLVAPGGILCGHDFGHDDWPGVEKAVLEVVSAFEVIPNTSIWRAL